MDVIQVDPSKSILKIGDNTIWDLSNIEEPGQMDALFSSNDLLKPEKIDENHVLFCNCIFDVKALIYEKATSDDILSGWTIARGDLKLDRLVNVFLRDSLYNLYLTRYFQEPDIILMLRLVYWYFRCHRLQSNETFKHKISERYRNAWFKDVWNVTSELLFAALCGERGFIVTFEPLSKDHDYDFLMNGYPVQIKSLNVSESLESAVDKMRQRKQSVDNDEITYEYVIQRILGAITNNIGEVQDALEQKAKIIFMNGTTDESSGSYLGQFSLEEPSRFTLAKSIELSIGLVKKIDPLFH